jgi:hypothetical protein
MCLLVWHCNDVSQDVTLFESTPVRTMLKNYIPSSWMSAEDEAVSPLLHRVADTATFSEQQVSQEEHSTSLSSPSRTQELVLSRPTPKSHSAAKPELTRSASLKRLTTKAEKIGQHMHVYGKPPSESQVKSWVHEAEAYAAKLAKQDPRGVVGSHWRDYTNSGDDWKSSLKAATAAAKQATVLNKKQQQELHDNHLRSIGVYAPPALLHALMSKPAATATPSPAAPAAPSQPAATAVTAATAAPAAPATPAAVVAESHSPAAAALSPTAGGSGRGGLPPVVPALYPGVSFFARLRELRSHSSGPAADAATAAHPPRTSALYGRDDDERFAPPADAAALSPSRAPAFDPVARDWHALMRHPPPVTPYTRPDIRDAREYPYPGRRWAARKREMQRFGSAIATYESDPELNPVLVMQVSPSACLSASPSLPPSLPLPPNLPNSHSLPPTPSLPLSFLPPSLSSLAFSPL